MISDLVDKLKEDVGKMLIQVMREEIRQIIRTEMREEMRLVVREVIREIVGHKENANIEIDEREHVVVGDSAKERDDRIDSSQETLVELESETRDTITGQSKQNNPNGD